MFTGIVSELAEVSSLDESRSTARLRVVLTPAGCEGLVPGASVAINGCCLTVAQLVDNAVAFDVIPETLRRTNLGDLSAGDCVNVERSARFGDEIGGHQVAGHVSAVAEVVEVREALGERVVTLMCAREWMRYLFYKGFVALDGASLTLSSVDYARNRLEVRLIPETLARTTFGFRRPGERVNLEVDAQTQTIVETIERLLGDPDWQARIGR